MDVTYGGPTILSSSLQSKEGLEVVEGELVGLLGAGEHALRQLELLLLQLKDPSFDGVLAQEAETIKTLEQT